MVRRFRCRLQRKAGCRACRKFIGAGARYLWGGGVVLELSARAPRRTSCGLPWRYKRALHPRKASLLRYAAVVRCTSCRSQRQAGCRVANKRKRAALSCLWGAGAALKLAGRAGRATLVITCLRPIEERRTGRRLLILARSCNAPFQLPPLTQSRLPRMQQAHSALSRVLTLAARLLRACRAALVAVCLDATTERCISGSLLSFCTRPWCDVSASASNAKSAAA